MWTFTHHCRCRNVKFVWQLYKIYHLSIFRRIVQSSFSVIVWSKISIGKELLAFNSYYQFCDNKSPFLDEKVSDFPKIIRKSSKFSLYYGKLHRLEMKINIIQIHSVKLIQIMLTYLWMVTYRIYCNRFWILVFDQVMLYVHKTHETITHREYAAFDIHVDSCR